VGAGRVGGEKNWPMGLLRLKEDREKVGKGNGRFTKARWGYVKDLGS